MDDDILEKGWKGIAAAAGLALAPSHAPKTPPHSAHTVHKDPVHVSVHPQHELAAQKIKTAGNSEWVFDKKGLPPELHPIAHSESSFGQNMSHQPSTHGQEDTAVGALGIKAKSGLEVYSKPEGAMLRHLMPEVKTSDQLYEKIKSNPQLYNLTAKALWDYNKKHVNGDLSSTVFAWRFGLGAAQKATPEEIQSSPYVQNYHKIVAEKHPFNKSEVNFAKTDYQGSKDFKQEAPTVDGKIKLHNYDHLLSPKHISQGYSLSVADVDNGKTIVGSVFHNGERVGQVSSDVNSQDKTVKTKNAQLDKKHQQKGLGKILHQSVWQHGHEVHGLTANLDEHMGVANSAYRAKINAAKEINVPYSAKAVFKQDLSKNMPIPKFPKLGITDDRKETPIISDPMSMHTKARLTANMVTNAKGWMPSREDQVDQTKKQFGNLPSSGNRRSGGATTPSAAQLKNIPGLSTSSYAVGNELRNPKIGVTNISPKTDLATKLHEDGHLLMSNLYRKNGITGEQSKNFSENLWNLARHKSGKIELRAKDNLSGKEAPPKVTNLMNEGFHNILSNKMFVAANTHPDEKIMHLISYLNDPAKRTLFKSKIKGFLQEHNRKAKLDPIANGKPIAINDQTINMFHQGMNSAAKNMYRNIQQVAGQLEPKDLHHFIKPPSEFGLGNAETHPYWQQNSERFLKGEEMEALEGGRAEGENPDKYNQEQLAEGSEHELEHTNKPKVSRRIAMDHLEEDPDYYKKLKAIE